MVLVAAFLVSGCGGAPGPKVRNEFIVAFTPEQIAQLQKLEVQEYVVHKGDVLAVRDMYHEELNQDYVLVLPDGSVGLFGIGQVEAAGMTLTELGQHFTDLYATEFREPRVTVAVRELGAAEVYVLGEVQRPGAYPVPHSGFSVMGAIASAGGFNTRARAKWCWSGSHRRGTSVARSTWHTSISRVSISRSWICSPSMFCMCHGRPSAISRPSRNPYSAVSSPIPSSP
jgi:hypothetical protein